MKGSLFRFLGLLIWFGLLIYPAIVSAQPGSQPIVFYGEEPWGGSYLGVTTEDVNAERLGQLHLKEERGVEVTVVDQDAPAGKAGIKEHDVILSINDQQVQSVEQLRRLIREIPPGRTITIGISRDGQPLTLKAQLGERHKTSISDRDFNFSPAIHIPNVHIPPINMPDIDVPSVVLIHTPHNSGLMVENLTPQLGDYFGVKGGNGVLVRSVEKGSRAEQAGFRAGDVIIKVNGSTVNDSSDFSRLLRARTADKASVTVMRDRKEQTLTLSLPPRRSGSLSQRKECEYLDPGACRELLKGRSQIEAQAAQLNEWLTPELERFRKQVREERDKHRDQLEKQLEIMRRDFRQKKQDFEKQVHEWLKKADI